MKTPFLFLAAFACVGLAAASAQAGPILTGLDWWLDASDSSTLTLSGSQVTQWNDKNPNVTLVDVSQSSPAQRPTLIPNALNGLPVVSFNAASQQNLNDGVAGGSPISGAVQTMFVVAIATRPATAEQDVFDSYPSETGGTPAFHALYTDTNGIHIFRGGGGGGDVVNGNYTTGDYILMTSVWDGASSSVAVDDNGSTTTTTGTLSTDASSPNDMFLGGISPGNFYNGGIAEILIYNSVLSSSDIQANDDYLIAKWFTAPEPASLSLLAVGGVMLLRRHRA